ncbi:hypothetical protein UUU_26800 (plasmid) [Klebsiella pneumoniae subsp. pneumoniae DSM 30104 = JCM 1662 = NBRC 14940]|nr:hypothetical protein UUU_26800 [Klebsiella pneumoniae subsp. pneumoniae DSM 30104 = JCM 1662 = NBRC 14940]
MMTLFVVTMNAQVYIIILTKNTGSFMIISHVHNCSTVNMLQRKE